MVAINVQAGVGAHLLDRDPEQARTTLRDIKKVSGDALVDLRSMLGLLRQEGDDDAPVLPTQGLAADRRPARGPGLGRRRRSTYASTPSADLLPATVGATGYRIVQEALTNVMRHAGPTAARVRVAARRRRPRRRRPHRDRGRRRLVGRAVDAGRRRVGQRAARHARARRRRRRHRSRPVRASTAAGACRSALPVGVAVSIRVLLVDDQTLVRAGFRALLDSEPDLEVVGEAVDGAPGGARWPASSCPTWC